MSINYLEVWSDNELIRPIDYQLARHFHCNM